MPGETELISRFSHYSGWAFWVLAALWAIRALTAWSKDLLAARKDALEAAKIHQGNSDLERVIVRATSLHEITQYDEKTQRLIRKLREREKQLQQLDDSARKDSTTLQSVDPISSILGAIFAAVPRPIARGIVTILCAALAAFAVYVCLAALVGIRHYLAGGAWSRVSTLVANEWASFPSPRHVAMLVAALLLAEVVIWIRAGKSRREYNDALERSLDIFHAINSLVAAGKLKYRKGSPTDQAAGRSRPDGLPGG